MDLIATLLQTPPFSFRADGKDSRDLLSAWPRQVHHTKVDSGQVETTTWRDPATGVEVLMHVRKFDDFPAVDWYAEIVNTGQAVSPLLEQVQALQAVLPVGNQRVRLHYANGSLCQQDDFLPQVVELDPRCREKRFAPQGGRSSNGIFPFMNLQLPGQGLVVGVGWSGQWAAGFRRDGDSLRITIGQETTRLRLRPGEKIRTPRVLLLSWQSEEPMDGQNALRQLLLAHYLPRVNGQVPSPPVASCLQFYYYQTGQAGEHLEMQALPRTAELGADTFWIDALWYGRRGRDWWAEVGSWVINPDRFPHGLKPIADAAHQRGMRFVLWFEPERVRADSILAQEHPEFLLPSDKNKDNLLLNLGDPKAWGHIVELLSAHIAQIGIDIYRQDFNFDPLPYWQQADGPERQGMTENLYIQGFYALWDELRRRHPNVWIDNCASGGRRIDLETLSRSLPLWASDFQDTPGLSVGMGLHVGDQSIISGLARWVPLLGGGVWNFQPYSVRAHAIGGFTFGTHIDFADYRQPGDPAMFDYKAIAARGKTLLGDGSEFPMDLARAAVAEHGSLQPFVTGDFWPLLPLTVSPHDWCAYQCHRHDLKAGFALFFRRHQSPFGSMKTSLRWIDPAKRYEVSLSPAYQEGPRRTMTGGELVELSMDIDQQPGSILLRYNEAGDTQ